MAETQKSGKPRRKAPAPRGGGKKACAVPSCKRAYRAKGLCFFHYKKWRRGELEGRPPRYRTCSKPDCKKKVAAHGLCQEHYDARKTGRRPGKEGAQPAPPAEAGAEAPAAG